MKTTRISIRLDRRVASAAAAGPFPARCPQPAPQNPPRARPAPLAGSAPSSPAKHAPARHTRVRDPRHTRVRDRPRTAGHVQCAATCRATDPPPLASIPHQRPVSAKAPAAACVHPSRACRVQGAAGPFLALGVRSQRSRACRAPGGGHAGRGAHRPGPCGRLGCLSGGGAGSGAGGGHGGPPGPAGPGAPKAADAAARSPARLADAAVAHAAAQG